MVALLTSKERQWQQELTTSLAHTSENSRMNEIGARTERKPGMLLNRSCFWFFVDTIW